MGYVRARRSVKIGSGVLVNLNKRSLGVTVGGRGAHYTVNTRGQRTTSVGLPGTGLSYVDRSGAGRARRAATGAPAARPARAPAPAKPGLFARRGERAFYEAIQKLGAGDERAALARFQAADQHDRGSLSPALLAGLLLTQLGQPAEAIPYLERVTTSDVVLPDKLMTKYAGALSTQLTIEETMHVPVEIGSVAASIMLSFCYRDAGRLDEAIGVMRQLHDHQPSPATMVILANLYAHGDEWDEIVELTAGVSNQDNITLLLCLQQAQALSEQGMPDAALAVYRDALSKRSRSKDLLARARYGRAKLYLDTGKFGMAKRDLGRLYADDPGYRDVAELLRGLQG